MRRVLTQVAHAAVQSKGSMFEIAYRKMVGRLGHNKTIWAIAHRLCRLVWKILHQGVSYIEYGMRPNPKAVQERAQRLLRDLEGPRLPGVDHFFTVSSHRMTSRFAGWVFDRAQYVHVPPKGGSGGRPRDWSHAYALDCLHKGSRYHDPTPSE